MDQARGTLKELEGRVQKLEGQLKLLEGQAIKARGSARVCLVRLEKRAASKVRRVKSALAASRVQVTATIEAGRRRVEKVTRRVEPALRRSLAQARELRVSATDLYRASGPG